MAQALVRFLGAQFSERDGTAAAVLRRSVRHFRPWQRRRDWPGARSAGRTASLLPVPQRTGDGPHGGGVRKNVEPAAHAGVHHVDRPRCDQYDDRRRRCDDQPPAGAAPAGRRLRQSRPGARPAATGIAADAGRVGERLFPAGVAVLGSHRSCGAVADGAPRSDARADLSGGDRRRHARIAAGHPDRSARIPGTVFRASRLDDPEAARRCGGDRARGGGDPIEQGHR